MRHSNIQFQSRQICGSGHKKFDVDVELCNGSVRLSKLLVVLDSHPTVHCFRTTHSRLQVIGHQSPSLLAMKKASSVLIGNLLLRWSKWLFWLASYMNRDCDVLITWIAKVSVYGNYSCKGPFSYLRCHQLNIQKKWEIGWLTGVVHFLTLYTPLEKFDLDYETYHTGSWTFWRSI